MNVTLPWPPSVNHYWQRNKNGGMRISAEGLSFRERVAWTLPKQPPLTGPLSVQIEAWAPDRRKRDLDNILKATLDALTHAGAMGDDSQVWDLRIYWASANGQKLIGGMVKVWVTPQ
jgi:crossover junction endodeoxyribonuclease RusA